MFTVRNRINKALFTAYVRGLCIKDTAVAKLREKQGNAWTDHALGIVIGVVLAALIFAAVVAILKNKVFPGLNNKVDDFFNVS